MSMPTLRVRELGLRPYPDTWSAMRTFTDDRGPETPDELWLLEHPPVYTQGLAGKPEHVLDPGDIPVIQTDRGGQVTYHGPGQLVAYPLLDLERLGLGIRNLVALLEGVTIDVLAGFGLQGQRREGTPGVFVGDAKIASIGMKVRRGCTFHGLAFNVGLDLAPFQRINPCGFAGQPMTRLADLAAGGDVQHVGRTLTRGLSAALGLDWCLESTHDASHPLTGSMQADPPGDAEKAESDETQTTEIGS
ncbi:MAG: lipoyl(octanoyl) transferase LipB [Wenzhouxiangellaceae bacterium]|nr:lipoyl(octanoyl) transferase LipB [Wenzhouxiangellaceae bacterium]MBS3747466.1 lipoyl(octanoyl) transferase LipB [Wenzhouxiangellaceae bacterium]MBS3822289.1 lipoyl(octanoyl) transferase LipB [Wenzhouxiangellaceae bacterium]